MSAGSGQDPISLTISLQLIFDLLFVDKAGQLDDGFIDILDQVGKLLADEDQIRCAGSALSRGDIADFQLGGDPLFFKCFFGLHL